MLIVIRPVRRVEITSTTAGLIAALTSLGSRLSTMVTNSRAASVWPISAASVVRKIRNGNDENSVMKAMWPA